MKKKLKKIIKKIIGKKAILKINICTKLNRKNKSTIEMIKSFFKVKIFKQKFN